MQLWKKAALVCVSVLLVVISSCASILLLYTQRTVLDLSRDQAKAKQLNLAASFSELTNYYITDKDSETVKESLLYYSFSRFSDDAAVLVKDGEILYSNMRIDPAKYLPLQNSLPEDETTIGEQRLCEAKTDGHDLLIVGSIVRIHKEYYCVYVVEDITDVHQSILILMCRFVIICLVGIMLGAFVLAFLLHYGAKPLATLSSVSKRIASGEYDVRADVNTKDEIGTLAADFNTMAQAVQVHIAELSETAERQRLFIGSVAHEFKTPLTAILLHTRLLQNVNMTDQEKHDSLSHIEKQCTWLESLTQKLLKTITLKQEIIKERITAEELINRVQASTQQIMVTRNTQLKTSCDDSSVFVDGDLMQSLLVNLVDNASKAYDPDSTNRSILLAISNNILEVRDTGRGIPADAIDRIFEPFYMVDKSRSKKTGSSGLGLALVKQIADAHDAHLEVNSAPGIGTTVRVILPKQKERNNN